MLEHFPAAGDILISAHRSIGTGPALGLVVGLVEGNKAEVILMEKAAGPTKYTLGFDHLCAAPIYNGDIVRVVCSHRDEDGAPLLANSLLQIVALADCKCCYLYDTVSTPDGPPTSAVTGRVQKGRVVKHARSKLLPGDPVVADVEGEKIPGKVLAIDREGIVVELNSERGHHSYDGMGGLRRCIILPEDRVNKL